MPQPPKPRYRDPNAGYRFEVHEDGSMTLWHYDREVEKLSRVAFSFLKEAVVDAGHRLNRMDGPLPSEDSTFIVGPTKKVHRITTPVRDRAGRLLLGSHCGYVSIYDNAPVYEGPVPIPRSKACGYCFPKMMQSPFVAEDA